MSYLAELTDAMCYLAADARTLFIGQAVKFPGQAAFPTFAKVPMERRIEMPVVEDFQTGFCTGLALEGFIPVSFYPRMDFLVIAMNQLLHLNVLPLMGYSPKQIIRTAIGSDYPINLGPQHTQNHTAGLRHMLNPARIAIIEIESTEDIMPAYKRALNLPQSCIVVEKMSEYRK